MKKIFSIILAIGMLTSIFITPVSAASSTQRQTPIDILPYAYSEVKGYILSSESEITLNIGGVPVHYYYGDGYTAYEKNGDYYIIYHNEDYSSFRINGYTIEVLKTSYHYPAPSIHSNHIYSANTTWTYLFTEVFWQISVGGLAVEAIMGMIPAGTFSSRAMEEIASFLLDKAIDLILPNNFAFTIRDDWYYGNLDPWLGTVDYSHDISAWWGYTRSPYIEHIVGNYYGGEIVERDVI